LVQLFNCKNKLFIVPAFIVLLFLHAFRHLPKADNNTPEFIIRRKAFQINSLRNAHPTGANYEVALILNEPRH